MATTKKSTKAKTKTTAAKTTKKSTSTKSVKTTAAKTAAKASVSTLANTVNKLNILSLITSLALAVLAGVLMSHQTYELVSGLMVKNEVAANGVAPFVTAVHHVMDLQLRWAVVTILALSAIVPLLHLTLKKDRYAEALKNKVNPVRWIEVGIIGALMVETIALLSGVSDLMTLKLLAGLVMLGAALAWVTEKRNTQANRPVKSEMVISIITTVLPWLLIAGFAINTYAYGLIRAPWYVYGLYAAVLAGVIGNCLELKKWVKGRTADYVLAERNYLVIGIVVKLAFAAVLIAGLPK